MFDRRAAPRWRLVLLAVCVVAACALLAVSVVEVSRSGSSNCEQIELLKASIRATLIQSEKTLGHPGTAGFEYYRAHPVELQDALAAQRAAIQNFAPHVC